MILKELDLTETINGKEVVSPSPHWKHQEYIKEYVFILNDYVRNKQIGKVLFAPLDVHFESGENVFQPDVIFLGKDKTLDPDRPHIYEAPDLVAEFVSPGSFRYDVIEKKEIYEKHGVKEYWLFPIAQRNIYVYSLEEGRYRIFSEVVDGEGTASSKLLSGFEVEGEEFYKEKS